MNDDLKFAHILEEGPSPETWYTSSSVNMHAPHADVILTRYLKEQDPWEEAQYIWVSRIVSMPGMMVATEELPGYWFVLQNFGCSCVILTPAKMVETITHGSGVTELYQPEFECTNFNELAVVPVCDVPKWFGLPHRWLSLAQMKALGCDDNECQICAMTIGQRVPCPPLAAKSGFKTLDTPLLFKMCQTWNLMESTAEAQCLICSGPW